MMKSLIVLALTLSAASSFALTKKLNCNNGSNSDLGLQIEFSADSYLVSKFTLTNIGASLRVEKVVTSQNPVERGVGFVYATAEDGTSLSIPVAVLTTGAGAVVVNGFNDTKQFEGEYNCSLAK
jgi:hypothetical protein